MYKTHNEEAIVIATYEALYDLLFSDIHSKSLEEKNIEQLNKIYGPEIDVNYEEAIRRGNIYNR